MDSRMVILVGLTVLAAGCAELPGNSTQSSSSSQGLVVEEFSVADKSLSPAQRTPVTVTLRNYHMEPVEIKDVSLYNLGFLELQEPGKAWKDRCTPRSMEQAREEFKPRMECSWVVKAPGRKELGDFDSKTVTAKLNLEYRSTISNNRDPFQVEFRPLENIDSRKKVRKKFSNGEVTMELATENPAPESGALLDISIRDANSGDNRRVASSYRMSYTPNEVFRSGGKGCPLEINPPTGTSADISCRIKPTGSGGARNLFISTSYKYVKSPNLDIEVNKP